MLYNKISWEGQRQFQLNYYPRSSFYALLNKFGDCDLKCAEIGVDEGTNAVRMLRASTKSSFVLVDPYIPYPPEDEFLTIKEFKYRRDIMLDRVKPYLDRVQFIEKSSIEATKEFPDEYFDYVYLDGNHKYEEIKQDIEAWFPKVKYTGILAGHDWHFTSINRAVNEILIGEKNLYVWAIEIRTLIANSKKKVPENYGDNSDWWVNKEYWLATYDFYLTKEELKHARR